MSNLQALVVPERTLYTAGARRGVLQSTTVEDVRDRLRRMEQLQEPEDLTVPLHQLHVDFSDGRMTIRQLKPVGVSPDPEMLVTRHGARLLAREVLPARFLDGLSDLAQLNGAGGRTATMAWALFAQNSPALRETPRLVRTIKTRLDSGEVSRVVRSVHSTGYADYSNLQLCEAILAKTGNDLPVLEAKVTDSAFRLRLALKPGGEITLREPIPMLECWNSEVGRRSVRIEGGMFRLVCTNGMGRWDDHLTSKFNHVGDAARLHKKVADSIEAVQTNVSGVIDAYNDALGTSIDDAFAFMEAELAKFSNFPQRAIDDAKKALSDPTTTPGGTLASVVDAVTLIAQKEDDMFLQWEMERAAATVLNRGRSIAATYGGRIPALA